jgi:putative endonuclease
LSHGVIASAAKQSRADYGSSHRDCFVDPLLAMIIPAVSRQYCVYILTNDRHTVLYTGVSSALKTRVYQHREKLLPGFTNRYNVCKLVYYEVFEDVASAITREKQIKAGSRQKKLDLINAFNLEWRDLYDDL